MSATSSAPMVFTTRTVLGHLPLDRLALRVATADGHHVAKVHGRHGVAEGLEFRIDGTGRLVLEPGVGYDPCGQLITIGEAVTIEPPARPGRYRVWLAAGGSVVVVPSGARPGPLLPLASVRALPRSVDHAIEIVWTAPIDLDGQARIPSAVAPRVGAGRERLGLQDVVIDADQHTISRQVNTVDAGFARPPLYFATIAVDRNLRSVDLERLDGWFTAICDVNAHSFRLTAYVDGTDDLFSELLLWQSLTSDEFSPVDFDLIWIGVDPRRDGNDPADLSCADQPPTVPVPV